MDSDKRTLVDVAQFTVNRVHEEFECFVEFLVIFIESIFVFQTMNIVEESGRSVIVLRLKSAE